MRADCEGIQKHFVSLHGFESSILRHYTQVICYQYLRACDTFASAYHAIQRAQDSPAA
jgi:hypothetical protein